MNTIRAKGPIHPGEILREEFLSPMNLTVNKLATSLEVPASRIDQIVKEKRSISAETAIRLSEFFGTSSEFWINLQTHYDLIIARNAIKKAVFHKIRAAKAKFEQEAMCA